MSGSRGPISMPDNVRQLRGNPGKRKTPPSAASRFVSAPPRPPTTMATEAKAEWKRIVPELHRTGVLAMTDRAVLATYCETWAAYRYFEKAKLEAIKLARRIEDPIERLEAMDKVQRIASASARERRLMLPLMIQLTLTPNSRLRTPAPKQEPDGDEDLD